jgi:hypothetical protein
MAVVMSHTVLCLVIAFGGVCAAERDFDLFLEGDDPNQFEVVGLKPDAITIRHGEIRLTSKEHGYVATKKSYRNYVLRFDWMYEPHHAQAADGNSGLLVHIQGPPKVWPESIEVQIWYKDFGSFYTLGGGKFNPQRDDRPARDKVLRPPGQWNTQEVICQGDLITVKVNGVEYASGTGAKPSEGRIGWMFEGSPIRFRELKIRQLD